MVLFFMAVLSIIIILSRVLKFTIQYTMTGKILHTIFKLQHATYRYLNFIKQNFDISSWNFIDFDISVWLYWSFHEKDADSYFQNFILHQPTHVIIQENTFDLGSKYNRQQQAGKNNEILHHSSKYTMASKYFRTFPGQPRFGFFLPLVAMEIRMQILLFWQLLYS